MMGRAKPCTPRFSFPRGRFLQANRAAESPFAGGLIFYRDNGIIPAIITQEKSEIALKRAEKLKVDEVYLGAMDKLKVIEELIEKHGLTFDEVAYIGDDVNDMAVLKKVGFSSAPADALDEVKKVVDYVTSRKGGEGAVREAIDVMLSQSKG